MIHRSAAALARRAATASSSASMRASTPAVPAAASRTLSSLPANKLPMYGVVPEEDLGEYKEYSVIFTNRSLNLMSAPFQTVMRDLNALLKETYKADKVAVIPG